MAIIAGDLRHIINVTRLYTITDDYGATVDSYNTVMTIRAAVKYLSGTKTINNDEIYNTQTLQLTTYHRDILDTDRIQFKNKNYKILFINEMGYREGMLITIELINE